jgi:hypothetical protein
MEHRHLADILKETGNALYSNIGIKLLPRFLPLMIRFCGGSVLLNRHRRGLGGAGTQSSECEEGFKGVKLLVHVQYLGSKNLKHLNMLKLRLHPYYYHLKRRKMCCSRSASEENPELQNNYISHLSSMWMQHPNIVSDNGMEQFSCYDVLKFNRVQPQSQYIWIWHRNAVCRLMTLNPFVQLMPRVDRRKCTDEHSAGMWNASKW